MMFACVAPDRGDTLSGTVGKGERAMMSGTRALCRSAALAFCLALSVSSAAARDDVSEDEIRIARNVATLLQSARTVIAENQDLINDPAASDTGLTGEFVLARTIELFRAQTGNDPMAIDAGSYEGRLMRAQMDAVAEVMDANQQTINAEGIGFKGFIPAIFARLVTEAFGRRMGEEASVKVTAPPELVRNRRSRPDPWEEAAIRNHLQSGNWPHGQIYTGIDKSGEEARVRIMVPEYYAASCLACHGGPKGERDITGYPKEGVEEGDLGGVISIRLVPQ